MKKLIAKFLLTMILITGVSANSFAAVDYRQFLVSGDTAGSQFDIYRAYGFLKMKISYLTEQFWRQGDRKGPDIISKKCAPENIQTKEQVVKCGF